MLDFLLVATRSTKRGVVEVYPKFIIKKSQDLMIRGSDFYAIWVEDRNLWSTDEQDAVRLIDHELDVFAEEHKNSFEGDIRVLHMWDSGSGMIDAWHKYCQRQMRDNFQPLDETLIFSNTSVKKDDYASKKLAYPLEAGSTTSYDALMSVLYSNEERQKIEWAIGSVVTGDSKKLQKFLVLYGTGGTGKGTVINIIMSLFGGLCKNGGYCSTFSAKDLVSANSAFALESFKDNPLVAIQHDGSLAKIEDNTRLNSVVSHEFMEINEKHKSKYSSRFKCFLFIGSNDPVKITNAKSGLIRRLIDVSPTGNKVSPKEYDRLMKGIEFELGAIAWHCREVYLAHKFDYDNYIPLAMLSATNDFFNFVEDAYPVFKREDSTTLKAAYAMYQTYCEDAKVYSPYSKRVFKEELKNYFDTFDDRPTIEGERLRNYYSGFRADKFVKTEAVKPTEQAKPWLNFNCTESIFDNEYADCKAQYAALDEKPVRAWERVNTTLRELDTSKLHYVLTQTLNPQHIVIDFDLKDEHGLKNYELNYAEACKWPATYAELSKSGQGIHLHYIYAGDVSKLERLYDKDIEIKVFIGLLSLRRRLSKCNDVPIATLNSGLPLKNEKVGNNVVNSTAVKSERTLRRLVAENLGKEHHGDTTSSIHFVDHILANAYESGLHYDISDMRQAVLTFAANATNQSQHCLEVVSKMHFKSDEPSEDMGSEGQDTTMVFYDVEVFPNLFVICWKAAGEGKTVIRMVNPSSAEVEDLMRFQLVGFNCRKYDNHILYARLMGYTNEQLYRLSKKIIEEKEGFFGEAYNISYTDILDFASAGNKKSLKKLEIEMGIHHQELGLPWDQPVPENLWEKVADYCVNDVIATEAAFHYLSADWTARQILADFAGMTVNSTTNSLTERIVFGNNKYPQKEFHYRDMGEEIPNGRYSSINGWTFDPNFTRFKDVPGPNGESIKLLPIFPGYIFDQTKKTGKSVYRGEEVGEGGYVYAEPGIHYNVALLDVASMHPSSIVAEELFGPRYTAKFKELLDARVAIKHEDWDAAEKMLDGKLKPYIQKVKNEELTSKQLANALKTAINSVYGLTSAKFDNPFRDLRNKDNIVAKRGALFMVNLKHEVQDRGFTVAHIKTDSIKIPDATPEIIQFVMAYGKLYGYSFEHEATYERMCLVNDAVYIAKYADVNNCQTQYNYIPDENKKHAGKWTATGTQFQVPYVFKTLFSRDEITFDDLCEIKSVETTLYLDMNEGLPDISWYEKELKNLDKNQADMTPEEREQYRDILKEHISRGHNYHFVGRVGQFCPIKPGCGGGELMRETLDKKTGARGYAAATGTKGYFWLESEVVRELGKEADIDREYYKKLAIKARRAIEKYGDFEKFANG